MSFTSGTTPRGLPYPGSDDPVYNIPSFLQQLAAAVQAQLNSAGTSQPLAWWSGVATTTSGGFISPAIPGLRVVRGALAMANKVTGGAGPYLYFLSPVSWTDSAQWGKAWIGVANPAVDGGGYPASVKNTAVGVNVLAWGDPA
jgi:hypothetical protein